LHAESIDFHTTEETWKANYNQW